MNDAAEESRGVMCTRAHLKVVDCFEFREKTTSASAGEEGSGD